MPTNFRVQLPAALRTHLLELVEKHRNVQYDMFVEGLAKPLPTVGQELHHMTTGLSGEAGECLDITKKLWIYEKPITDDVVEHLIEELGDARWYYQGALNQLGITDEMVRAYNAEKLLKRYPNAVYSNAAALARADKVPGEGRKFFGAPDKSRGVTSPVKDDVAHVGPQVMPQGARTAEDTQ